jgi:uncharacterized protein
MGFITMIEVRVTRVVIYNNELIVLLKGEGEQRVLPIHVDPGQAHAIELHLEGLTFPRPLTHDLMKTVIDHLEGHLDRVVVTDLVDGTFHARLFLLRNGKEVDIDARPSDAIALALRCGAPILVEDEVMAKAGVVIPADQQEERKRKHTPAEQVEQKLAKAIEEERYEDAAGLRDELKRLKEGKTSN